MTRGRLASACAVLVLAATACPGDDDGFSDNFDRRPTVDATEYAFSPDVLAAAPNGQVTFELRNRGKEVHNLSIPSINADIDFQPGDRQNIIFVAPSGGEVVLFCKYHQERGMKATIVVRG